MLDYQYIILLTCFLTAVVAILTSMMSTLTKISFSGDRTMGAFVQESYDCRNYPVKKWLSTIEENKPNLPFNEPVEACAFADRITNGDGSQSIDYGIAVGYSAGDALPIRQSSFIFKTEKLDICSDAAEATERRTKILNETTQLLLRWNEEKHEKLRVVNPIVH